MYQTLREKHIKDDDYPQRVFDLKMREAVRDGTLYSCLKFAFHEESNSAGEYILLRDRRPSVRFNLCRMVIHDSVSILFSEGHFPVVQSPDKETRDALAVILKDRAANMLMVDLATRGSVGSAVLLMKMIDGKLFFEALDSKFLTPTYSKNDPDKLVKITESYKVKRADLEAAGVPILAADKDEAEFWWRSEWTENAEVHFFPQSKSDYKAGKAPVQDESRTVTHNLGFVAAYWVKNLPGGSGPDGACTFPDEAVDTQIELEYQLSQVGRGLKYSSDPTLLIKEPAVAEGADITKGAGNAIVVSKDGDAKLLEINGSAADTVMTYIRMLREFGLESLQGRSADPAKLSAARSAKAMELLNQPLIWLADKLRVAYGEGALLALAQMIVKVSKKHPIKAAGRTFRNLQEDGLSLQWPSWYAPTQDEKQTKAITLDTLVKADIMSRETAVGVSAPDYDIEDLSVEERATQAQFDARIALEKELKKPPPGAAQPTKQPDA